MTAGALLSIIGVLGLITAASSQSIWLCGILMALGSAAFVGANWALTTELAPPCEAARFMGLANFGIAGAAAAGLLGPLVDWGGNYQYQNVLGNVLETVHSGAFVPFDVATTPGQVVAGSTKCSGSILRCNPDGSDLEVVACGVAQSLWSCLSFDGRLFATEHGMDDRGGRYIVGDVDDFYAIAPGEWYGWPDFASGIRLDDHHWGAEGQGRAPVLAEFPNPKPLRPFASFEPHAAANGVSFSPPAFGFGGDAFVALFGDIAPVTTMRLAAPPGFKVVRVDMENRRIVDFAVNKVSGPPRNSSMGALSGRRIAPSGPEGALYVVDYGKIQLAPEVGGVRMVLGTGALWRIRRTGDLRGAEPPQPRAIPIYGLQYGLPAFALGMVLLFGLIVGVRRRRGREKRRQEHSGLDLLAHLSRAWMMCLA